ncbi:MAG: hypothetical protein DRP71_02920 [Verrucomicrobia bacterium]|nr:MAG: hypothetical protein DRP71_02920 [Verrucomicrobiota bacterium]
MGPGSPPDTSGFLGRLLAGWRRTKRAWSGVRAFGSLPRQDRRLVFYAETAADWAYLEPVVTALGDRGNRVLKIASDPNDPVLDQPDSFFVGSGSARTAFFKSIDADAFVMTLSDLQTYHLKRSVFPVHYFYIFHSIASTHRVYREHAFDAYDTVLCVGPHHMDEIRKTEAAYGLKPKHLLPHGYGRLDTLIQDISSRGKTTRQGSSKTSVLVAPSWGECSIVEHCLEPLLESLLEGGLEVTIRFHPMTRRHNPDLVAGLLAKYESTGRFHFDPHINTTDSLLAADIMISEWSGAPLEFAFARERPVIFIDTPPKIHNSAHKRVDAPMLEVDIREEIGRVVSMDALDRLPAVIDELVGSVESWSGRIRKIREETVFNVGRSGEAGAEAILETLDQLPTR